MLIMRLQVGTKRRVHWTGILATQCQLMQMLSRALSLSQSVSQRDRTAWQFGFGKLFFLDPGLMSGHPARKGCANPVQKYLRAHLWQFEASAKSLKLTSFYMAKPNLVTQRQRLKWSREDPLTSCWLFAGSASESKSESESGCCGCCCAAMLRGPPADPFTCHK